MGIVSSLTLSVAKFFLFFFFLASLALISIMTLNNANSLEFGGFRPLHLRITRFQNLMSLHLVVNHSLTFLANGSRDLSAPVFSVVLCFVFSDPLLLHSVWSPTQVFLAYSFLVKNQRRAYPQSSQTSKKQHTCQSSISGALKTCQEYIESGYIYYLCV